MSNDKLPALPPRPKSFRAKTFDPYDDVFGYAETKGHMDAQDARIAELEKDRDAAFGWELRGPDGATGYSATSCQEAFRDWKKQPANTTRTGRA